MDMGTIVAIAAGGIILGYLILKNRHLYFVLKAQRVFASQGLSGALVWYRKAYGTGNMKLRMAVTYAFLLLKNGETAEAEKVLDRQRKRLGAVAPSNPDLCFIRTYQALVMWKKGDLAGATSELMDLREKGYTTAALYGSLGWFLIEEGKLEKALEVNLEAREYDGNDAVILDNLALNWRLLGDMEKASEADTALMALDPKFPEAWYNHGVFLVTRGGEGDLVAARESLEKALTLPLNPLSTIQEADIRSALEKL